MGWVGVGSLIATAGYFAYRYPPRRWTGFSDPPEPTSDVPPVSPTADEHSQAKNGVSDSNAPLIEIEEDESQTTPKASAATPSGLPVPTLSLDEDTSGSATSTDAPTPPMQRNMARNTPSTDRGGTAPRSSLMLAPPSQRPPAPDSSLMPPPPAPRPRPTPNGTSSGQLQPPRPNNMSSSLRPPPSAASSLRVPPSGGSGSRLSSSTLAPQTLKKPSNGARNKVILEPGYSPLDWAALAAKPNNQLRGAGMPPGLLRVTPSMLKTQNGRKGRDAWTSYQGRIYNISPYLPYHPGGKGELLRGAGKDSAKLFQEIHPWVNWDGILGECLVGILVSENDIFEKNNLDAMD